VLDRKDACVRKRRERLRRKLGLKGYGLDLPEFDLVEALQAAERLTEAEALDQERVEAALTDVLRDWIARWECRSVTAKPFDP
jgi:hypothetical protein